MSPASRIVATLVFMVAVVSTPPHAVWVFALDLALVLGLAAWSKISMRTLLGRLRLEVPFVAFAICLPLIGGAPRTELLGVSVSEPGLWAAWNIVAKATLGMLAVTVLATTTPSYDLLRGLERLRVPAPLVQVGSFMIRYLDVVADDARRMRIARLARAGDPRWLWQAGAIASTAGTLFVRSYERGERIHRAMLARGYSGTIPPMLDGGRGRPDGVARPGVRTLVAAIPAIAVAAMLAARIA